MDTWAALPNSRCSSLMCSLYEHEAISAWNALVVTQAAESPSNKAAKPKSSGQFKLAADCGHSLEHQQKARRKRRAARATNGKDLKLMIHTGFGVAVVLHYTSSSTSGRYSGK